MMTLIPYRPGIRGRLQRAGAFLMADVRLLRPGAYQPARDGLVVDRMYLGRHVELYVPGRLTVRSLYTYHGELVGRPTSADPRFTVAPTFDLSMN